MLYLFDYQKNLIGAVNEDDVHTHWQTKELNGLISALVTGRYHSKLDKTAYFGTPDVDEYNQFIMYKVVRYTNDNGIFELEGIHTFFDDLKTKNVILEESYYYADVRTVLNAILAGTGWKVGEVSTTVRESIDFRYINGWDAFKEFLERWYVEFELNVIYEGNKVVSQTVDIHDEVGGDNGLWYEYSDKLISVVKEEDTNEVYTTYFARGSTIINEDGERETVTISDVEWIWPRDPMNKPKGQPALHFEDLHEKYQHWNGEPRHTIVEFPDIKTSHRLIVELHNYVVENARPKVEFKTVISPEHEYVNLGEYIIIKREDLNISYKVRVFEIKRNFKNPDEKEFRFGDKLTQSNYKRLNDQIKKTAKKEDEKDKKELLDYLTDPNSPIGDGGPYDIDEEFRKRGITWYESGVGPGGVGGYYLNTELDRITTMAPLTYPNHNIKKETLRILQGMERIKGVDENYVQIRKEGFDTDFVNSWGIMFYDDYVKFGNTHMTGSEIYNNLDVGGLITTKDLRVTNMFTANNMRLNAKLTRRGPTYIGEGGHFSSFDVNSEILMPDIVGGHSIIPGVFRRRDFEGEGDNIDPGQVDSGLYGSMFSFEHGSKHKTSLFVGTNGVLYVEVFNGDNDMRIMHRVLTERVNGVHDPEYPK